jgi:hypothetical protein
MIYHGYSNDVSISSSIVAAMVFGFFAGDMRDHVQILLRIKSPVNNLDGHWQHQLAYTVEQARSCFMNSN